MSEIGVSRTCDNPCRRTCHCHINEVDRLIFGIVHLSSALAEVEGVLDYLGVKENWYVDGDGWMVLLRPRDSYVAGEASTYINPWVYATEAMKEDKDDTQD